MPRHPTERVPLRTAPGAQVAFQLRRGPRDFNLLAYRNAPQGSLNEQMPAFVETQVVEVYQQRATTAFTNSSTVPNRRSAASRLAYPSVRPGCHCFNPSISSSGRISGSAYDMPSNNSRNR